VSVLETALIYGGIPLAVVLLVVIWVYGRSLAHQPNRYRPGKPWAYPPVWYLPHADTLDSAEFDRPALEGATRRTTAVGGASGEW
jgi:hypothetical protein